MAFLNTPEKISAATKNGSAIHALARSGCRRNRETMLVGDFE
eukprot:CAMPEP_0194033224 /NCGR_PEP_ID=MMETSP0009_2-20130614/5988_1 /TAXON_ID=210454 /ORGANISM="Grammatophora oceanica, Strain CCMP 410" /LENGTH=41 /DNA_ID= /DNA_START= /DNA_END= /DNA_ORIENTATION=